MDKSLKLINVDDFKEANSKNVEVVSNTLYTLALDSILCNKIESLENVLKSVSNNFEKINNYLELEKSSNMVCFHYGKIVSITNLILDIVDDRTLSGTLDNIAKSYSLLLPALKIIKKHNTISGAELQKEMDMKASSNLSNFLKRIDKYKLVTVRKIGTTNYISLTLKGERLLSKNKNMTSTVDESMITLTELFCLLDGISDELAKTNSSSAKLMHNNCPSGINIREKRLLKQKIDRIFYTRDMHMRLKFKSVTSIPAFDVFNDFDAGVLMTDDENINYDTYEKIEFSY